MVYQVNSFNPFKPKIAKFQTEEKNIEFQFGKNVKSKQYHIKVLRDFFHSFHLNETLGFHPQT